MASRISQMRNGMPMLPQQPQQPLSQQQLNESIERTRELMQQMKGAPNKEALIMNLLQSNPQLGAISGMLHNGNSLEGIAKSMAQMGGYNLNEIIQQLQGGL